MSEGIFIGLVASGIAGIFGLLIAMASNVHGALILFGWWLAIGLILVPTAIKYRNRIEGIIYALNALFGLAITIPLSKAFDIIDRISKASTLTGPAHIKHKPYFDYTMNAACAGKLNIYGFLVEECKFAIVPTQLLVMATTVNSSFSEIRAQTGEEAVNLRIAWPMVFYLAWRLRKGRKNAYQTNKTLK